MQEEVVDLPTGSDLEFIGDPDPYESYSGGGGDPYDGRRYAIEFDRALADLGYGPPADRLVYQDLMGPVLEQGLAGALESAKACARHYLEGEQDPASDDSDPDTSSEKAVRFILGFPEAARPPLSTEGSVLIGEGVYRLDSETRTAEILMGTIARDGKVVYRGETFTVDAVADYARLQPAADGSLYLPPSVERIGKCAFLGRSDICEVDLTHVEEIGDFAFCGCSRLESVVRILSLSRLGRYSFARSGISHAVLGPWFKKIPEGAFMGAGNLSTVRYVGRVKEIGDYAFKDTGLFGINLPEGLEIIGDSAFENAGMDSYFGPCSMEVEIPSSLKYMGSMALAHVGSLKLVVNRVFETGSSPLGYNREVTIEDRSGVDGFAKSLLEGI